MNDFGVVSSVGSIKDRKCVSRVMKAWLEQCLDEDQKVQDVVSFFLFQDAFNATQNIFLMTFEGDDLVYF